MTVQPRPGGRDFTEECASAMIQGILEDLPAAFRLGLAGPGDGWSLPLRRMGCDSKGLGGSCGYRFRDRSAGRLYREDA